MPQHRNVNTATFYATESRNEKKADAERKCKGEILTKGMNVVKTRKAVEDTQYTILIAMERYGGAIMSGARALLTLLVHHGDSGLWYVGATFYSQPADTSYPEIVSGGNPSGLWKPNHIASTILGIVNNPGKPHPAPVRTYTASKQIFGLFNPVPHNPCSSPPPGPPPSTIYPPSLPDLGRFVHANFLLDNAVPRKLLNICANRTGRKFTHMWYSTATCDPNVFKGSGFTSVRQMHYDPPRRTVLTEGPDLRQSQARSITINIRIRPATVPMLAYITT
ncbi:hypothetical protein CVT25_007334 [Psilocybe cyanescens]|uniref:Chitin synthase N-terminal domain-containing protein n=1 Tax=Psilocybe cyanescens TaxID=93625 RepID=A0A409XJD8_PSICY|nr:hypothetical protein CVT25_007334 [Psilocybe cyanescens]